MVAHNSAIFNRQQRGDRCFAHPDAYRVYENVTRDHAGREVVIDLSGFDDATSSAFARLILLRRALRSAGGDLRIAGLRDRAARLFEVSQLGRILPTV